MRLHHVDQPHDFDQIDQRPGLRSFGAVSVAAVIALCGAMAAACGSTRTTAPVQVTAGSSTTVSIAPTTSVTTVPKSTTAPTTATSLPPAIPVAPQPSAQAAAAALVAGWSAGNKLFALSVATSAAVAALFAVPYESGNAVFRGCSEAFTPIVCTYGPPGGGNGAIYEVNVSPSGADWYVSSVVVED